MRVSCETIQQRQQGNPNLGCDRSKTEDVKGINTQAGGVK